MPILQQEYSPGSNIRVDLHNFVYKLTEQTIDAHEDAITALAFDTPFGTMVTASMDGTMRIWDLSRGECQGLLEGHNGKL